MKFSQVFLMLIALGIAFVSCSDNPTSANLKTDLAGTWIVTRTLVTPSSDFPNGYQDQQEWTFTVSGETAVLKNVYGSVNGIWGKTQVFNYDHWIFEVEWYDNNLATNAKLVVEIIAVDKLKGTNETYIWDAGSSRYLLLDAFRLEGVRKK